MKTPVILHHCLYFTASALARQMARMAEKEFARTGLSPSHAFVVLVVADQPGISQREVADCLQLNQSTITRFVDLLVARGLVERRPEGKITHLFPTAEGRKMQRPLQNAWGSLHERYSAVLGESNGKKLNATIDEAAQKLAGQEE